MVAIRAGDIQALAAVRHAKVHDPEGRAATDGDGAVVVPREALVVLAAQVADHGAHQLEAAGKVDPDSLQHVVARALAQPVVDAAGPGVGDRELHAPPDDEAGPDAPSADGDPVEGEAVAVLDPEPGVALHLPLGQRLVVLLATDHRHIGQPEVRGALDHERPQVILPCELPERAVGQAPETGSRRERTGDAIGPAPAIDDPAAHERPLQRGGVVGYAVALRPSDRRSGREGQLSLRKDAERERALVREYGRIGGE